MFKSKLRFQIRHEDFRQRISQDEEDINSILNWYKLTDAVFLDYLSQVNIVKLRLGSGTQAQSGSNSGSMTQAQ